MLKIGRSQPRSTKYEQKTPEEERMRVVLRSGFDRLSGYGNDAVDMAVFLEKAGVDVVPWPTSLLPPLPRPFTRLLEKDPRGPKDVVLTYAPPYEIRPWEFAKMAPKSVGWSMWERLPLLERDFLKKRWPIDLPEEDLWSVGMPDVPLEDRRLILQQKRAWAGLDHLFVTCPMNVEAFRNVDEVTPMSVLSTGIDDEQWPVLRRDPQKRMQFLMVGMLGGRKVPFVLLDAWRELKAEHPEFDATLVLHTLRPGLHPKIEEAYPDVEISQKPLDKDGLVGLYHASDVLVSVSRGEGVNKPALEFMATGGTVIATDWSGHQTWLHRDCTVALPGVLEPNPKVPEAQDFAVDTDALKQALLDRWRDRSGTARMGEKASRWVRQTASWPVIVENLIRTLTRL